MISKKEQIQNFIENLKANSDTQEVIMPVTLPEENEVEEAA